MHAAGLVSAALAAGLVASPMVTPQAPPQKRVLYVTHSAGFQHDVLPLSERLLPEIGRRHGFDVSVTKDASGITAESLNPYAAVVFYTTGELPMSDGQKAEFMQWIRSGRGFVGVHSATDTFYEWPEYGEMIGGYFDEHPWHTKVALTVEDRSHPSTAHLGATWSLTDEIYQFRNYSRRDKHVLISLDTTSVNMKARGVKRTDGDFGIAWHRRWGQGRMFYTALGHRPEVWQDESFQKHLAGGITWAMGGS